MSNVEIKKIPPLKKEIILPGDKSISHRAVMLSSIAKGETLIKNFLPAQDCLHTLLAFEKMGVLINRLDDNQLLVNGVGLRGLAKPDSEIYLGNSGTSMRLLLGISAGQKFETILTGDSSLSKRPMKRVTHPLRKMGAEIRGKDDANYAPLKIKGKKLKSIKYNSPIASAQVKSCLMLASLYADGKTVLTEPEQSRDHTERMFKLFGADILVNDKICVNGGRNLTSPGELNIPSDISSAAFFIALANLLPESEITIKSCGINPTRMGFVKTLKSMGASIEITNIRGEDFEPYADIIVKSSKLKAISVDSSQMPKMIDEIPILALVSALAQGTTVIKGIGELRVKETDRVSAIVTNLKAFGVDIISKEDEIRINGPTTLKPAKVKSFGDHRTAMTMIIAASLAHGESVIEDTDCINTSFPGFIDIITL